MQEYSLFEVVQAQAALPEVGPDAGVLQQRGVKGLQRARHVALPKGCHAPLHCKQADVREFFGSQEPKLTLVAPQSSLRKRTKHSSSTAIANKTSSCLSTCTRREAARVLGRAAAPARTARTADTGGALTSLLPAQSLAGSQIHHSPQVFAVDVAFADHIPSSKCSIWDGSIPWSCVGFTRDNPMWLAPAAVC